MTEPATRSTSVIPARPADPAVVAVRTPVRLDVDVPRGLEGDRLADRALPRGAVTSIALGPDVRASKFLLGISAMSVLAPRHHRATWRRAKSRQAPCRPASFNTFAACRRCAYQGRPKVRPPGCRNATRSGTRAADQGRAKPCGPRSLSRIMSW